MSRPEDAVDDPVEVRRMTPAEHVEAAFRFMAHAAPRRLGSPVQLGATSAATTHLLAALVVATPTRQHA